MGGIAVKGSDVPETPKTATTLTAVTDAGPCEEWTTPNDRVQS
jgi:hypothetical protein